jgi:hypothetical protein
MAIKIPLEICTHIVMAGNREEVVKQTVDMEQMGWKRSGFMSVFTTLNGSVYAQALVSVIATPIPNSPRLQLF